MTILKTGLIGAGVFGGYHAGKIAASAHTDFIGVFDPDQARCAALAETHAVTAFTSQADLLAAADAVIIACPATYHEAVVKAALEADGLDALAWEPSRGGALFPHLYAPLTRADVRWAKPLPLQDGAHVFPDEMI